MRTALPPRSTPRHAATRSHRTCMPHLLCSRLLLLAGRESLARVQVAHCTAPLARPDVAAILRNRRLLGSWLLRTLAGLLGRCICWRLRDSNLVSFADAHGTGLLALPRR